MAPACQSDAAGCSWNGRRMFSFLHQQSRALMASSTIALGFSPQFISWRWSKGEAERPFSSRVRPMKLKLLPIVWRTGHHGPVGLASDGLCPSCTPLSRIRSSACLEHFHHESAPIHHHPPAVDESEACRGFGYSQ